MLLVLLAVFVLIVLMARGKQLRKEEREKRGL